MKPVRDIAEFPHVKASKMASSRFQTDGFRS